jgi:streptogramin lyase
MTHKSASRFAGLGRSGPAALVAAALSCWAGTARAGTPAISTARGPLHGSSATPSAAGTAGFFTLPPCRIADTRAASGVPLGRPSLSAGATRVFPVRRLCGLPDNAIAVSLNITVTSSTGAGDLRLFPGGASAPLASVINYATAQTRANNSLVPIGPDGTIVVQCDQAPGVVDVILDVNGFFVLTANVPVPAGVNVRVRPATEVELTFDNVTTAGTAAVQLLEFADTRSPLVDQHLKLFFPNGSPEQALVPDVIVPSYVTGIGKGGPGGTPTMLLAIIDTSSLAFSRTAEFHGLEDFRLGWDPPCVSSTLTDEPRTFYAREALKGEPALVEETAFGGPVFVDISSGCGSNKGSGWNFSAYLTGRDTRTPDAIAQFMLQRIQDALGSTALGPFITNGTVAANLLSDAQAALANVNLATPAGFTSALANVADFIGIVDGNPSAFNNSARNVSGELAGRGQSASYMIRRLVTPGTFAEFPIPTAGAGAGRIVTGPDRNLWFAEYNVNQIGRVTRSGVMTEFAVPTGNSQPYGIAAGSDGNVWFTEGNASKIGRITPAGVITEFTIPTAFSRTLAITPGPDGNLWFTELNGNKIGRIVPTTGVITEFPAAGQPYGIVTGPDGNLWFTEYTGNKIGVITTAGVVVKEFPVPTPGSNPYGIAVGPDGNVWFGENIGNKIGFVTQGGAITEFALPAGDRPTWLTTAPDGNIWFLSDVAAGKVGRITTAGVITEFPVPSSPSNPYGITVGPDGNLWFCEGGTANKVGRITP